MAESSQIEHREQQQQPDTTNTNTSTIEATTKTSPGRYKIPRRELAKREIRRLVLQEGLSGPQVSARLSIPTRTVTRYLQEIYKEDNELLIKPSIEELTTIINMFRDRIDKQRLDVLNGIANNPEVEAVDRMAAHDFVADIDWIITKLSFQAPVLIAKLLDLTKDNKLVVKEQKGLNFTLVDKLSEICKQLPQTRLERQG